jgi:hypothetical protein
MKEFTCTDRAPMHTTAIYQQFSNVLGSINDFVLFDRECSVCEGSECRTIMKSAGH